MAFALRVNVKYIHFCYPYRNVGWGEGVKGRLFHPSPFPSPLPSEGRGDSGPIVLENSLQPE